VRYLVGELGKRLLPHESRPAWRSGAAAYFWRWRDRAPWELAAWFTTLLFGVWGAGLTRGSLFVLADSPFLPAARYAYPAVTPAMLLLNLG
jgi:hypothetical protein